MPTPSTPKKLAPRTTRTVPITAIAKSSIFTRSSLSGTPHAELIQSIEATGGPIHRPVVREVKKGGYEIVAGYRRWEAVKATGAKFLEVDIVNLNDRDAAVWLLSENEFREGLGAMDQADLYWRTARLLDQAEPKPKGGGSTPRFLSQRRAAALLARHVGKAEDTIRKVLQTVPSKSEDRERLRKVGGKVEHILRAQRIIAAWEKGRDVDREDCEKFWVDLAEEAAIKQWSVRDLTRVGMQRYKDKVVPSFFPHPAADSASEKRLDDEAQHRCPFCGRTWQGECFAPFPPSPAAEPPAAG